MLRFIPVAVCVIQTSVYIFTGKLINLRTCRSFGSSMLFMTFTVQINQTCGSRRRCCNTWFAHVVTKILATTVPTLIWRQLSTLHTRLKYTGNVLNPQWQFPWFKVFYLPLTQLVLSRIALLAKTQIENLLLYVNDFQ